MAILPVNIARVSNLLTSNITSQQIGSVQAQLLQLQNELSTGKRINLPSDDPADAATAMQIQKTIDTRTSYSANLTAANNQLSEVDSTLGDISTLVTQAQTIASQNAGTDVTADARKSAAAVVDSLYNQALSLANKQFEGKYLFGGDTADTAPYSSSGNGVTYTGTDQTIDNTWDESYQASLQVGGQSVFAAGGNELKGGAINPALSTSTRISDLGGATEAGVSLGSIAISNGTTTATIDLSKAQSIGDVINQINAAGLAGLTATVPAHASGIQLNSASGATLSVNEVGGGSTASDLGILQTSALAANTAKVGATVNAKVTDLTTLASLNHGFGVDPGAITITNGTATATVSDSGLTTVQDFINKINGSGVGVTAAISSDGSGITVTNDTQGASMTISESNSQLGIQLGLKTMSATTQLASLNNGKGVGVATGADLQVTRQNGTIFQVDLSSAKTIQDVITAINAADGGNGVTASLAFPSNGITLTDTTTGTTKLGVTDLNFSTAAEDLGFNVSPSGNTLTSADKSGIAAGGLFASLKQLRDSLANNDTAGITTAAVGLTAAGSQVINARGANGATLQEISSRQDRIEDETTASKSLLSTLVDADYTTVVTRYTTLQTALQAAMKAGSISMQQSLMDFLS